MAPELKEFDPYYKWLGIPRDEQPPNHYCLLGIRIFEADQDVIETAAEQRMAHLRSRQSGKHASQSQRLLNEIASARLELLLPEQKDLYDQHLRQQLPVPSATVPVADTLPTASVDDSPFVLMTRTPIAKGLRRRPAKRANNSLGLGLCLGSALALAALVAAIVVRSAIEKQLAREQQPRPKSGNQRTKMAAVPRAGKPAKTKTSQQRDKITPRPRPATEGPTVAIAIPEQTQPASPAPEERAAAEDRPLPGVPADEPPAVAAASEVKRTSPPSDDELKMARSTLKHLYKQDFGAAKSPQQKSQLAARLVQEGLAIENDTVGQYALFESARDLADAAGDARMALQVCDHLARYEVETLQLKHKSLEKCGKQARKLDDWRQLCNAALTAIEEAVAQDDYAAAQELMTLAQQFARKVRDRELVQELSAKAPQLAAAATAYEGAKTALQHLESDAGDAASHLIAGKFLGFVKGNWPQAIWHLSQGSDEGLAKIAELERGRSLSPAAWVEIGDAWSNQAELAEATEQGQFQQRAAYWYRLAISGLSGLAKARVEQKLRKLPGE